MSLGHDIDEEIRTKDVQIDENVNFEGMLLPDFIFKGLRSSGFKRPSPIQLAAIPLGRCGLDLIIQAKSGTGKTLVFSLLALETIDMNIKRTQAIVVAPTREIAVQISEVIESVGRFCKGLKVRVLIGGTPMENNRAQLQKCQIVVGAPGRIRHLIEKEVFDSKAVRLIVLDEADKLMEEVFVKDINYIFNNSGESKQVITCSATYPSDLISFVKQYMKRGIHITPKGGPCPILLGLKQFVYMTEDHCNSHKRQAIKQEVLFRILGTVQFDQCLVFSNYLGRTETLIGVLQNQGWSVSCLNSGQPQDKRLEAIVQLKEHKSRILVTTDLSARGIDAPAVNLVINMEVPHSPEIYLHRIGRAGRFGNKGLSITIVSKGQEVNKFRELIGKIDGGKMAVSIVPDRCSDLWNEEEFGILEGIFEEAKEEIEEIEVNDENKGDTNDSIEEGEIIGEDHSKIGEWIEVKDSSSSSGVDLSSNASPDSSQNFENCFPSNKPSGLHDNRHMVGNCDNSLDRVAEDFASLRLENQSLNASRRHNPGPWRHGHENLWRNGRPYCYFPAPFRNVYRGHSNGFYDNAFFGEPTFRYNAHPRSNCLSSRGPWVRQNYWMNNISSQIDNYIHYARRFHS